MDTQTLRKLLEEFRSKLPDSFKSSQLVVFGSYANGNAALESDIDVFVVSEKFTLMSDDRRLDILYKASAKIEQEIHPWGITPHELEHADPQSTIGHARAYGINII